jgi:hypothetical protein
MPHVGTHALHRAVLGIRASLGRGTVQYGARCRTSRLTTAFLEGGVSAADAKAPEADVMNSDVERSGPGQLTGNSRLICPQRRKIRRK